MTQYTHRYVRGQCNNYIDANGVVVSGPCSHVKQYQLPHCAQCQRPADHSVHQVEIGSVQ